MHCHAISVTLRHIFLGSIKPSVLIAGHNLLAVNDSLALSLSHACQCKLLSFFLLCLLGSHKSHYFTWFSHVTFGHCHTPLTLTPQDAAHQERRHLRESKPSHQCDMCSGEHFIVMCAKFRDLTITKRMEVAKERCLCYSCLGRHNINKCNSTKLCKSCGGRYHTMLHGGDLEILFGPQRGGSVVERRIPLKPP